MFDFCQKIIDKEQKFPYNKYMQTNVRGVDLMKRYIYIQKPRRFILVLTMFFILLHIVLGIVFHFPNVKGATKSSDSIYFKSIQVEYGDNLWTIAQKNKPQEENIFNYIQSIKKLNQMKNNYIYAGDSLIIPINIVQ